jgi:cobalamin synthase
VTISLTYRQFAAFLGVAVIVALLVAFSVPADAFAGRLAEIGRNVQQEVTLTVGALFLAGLALAVAYLAWRRLYGEAMVALIAAVVVVWVVFTPDSAKNTLEGIAKDFFGGKGKG